MNIKIKTHRYRGGEWVTHSEPIKEAAHICYNKLFAVLQLTSSSEEKKHKCSLQINNSTGRKIRHPISKYMTFNYALFGLLCLYNYWKTSKIKKIEHNEQNLVNETSQRSFSQSASPSQPDLLPVLITHRHYRHAGTTAIYTEPNNILDIRLQVEEKQ